MLSFVKIKAILLIYLTLATYAHDVAKHLHGTIPLVESNETFEPPEKLIIGYKGTYGCESSHHEMFADVDGQIYQLLTPNGTTLCNVSDIHDVVYYTLFSNRTLEERPGR